MTKLIIPSTDEQIDAKKHNIIFIDQYIKRLLLYQYTQLSEKYKERNRLKWISTTSPILSDRTTALTKLSYLNKIIQDTYYGFCYAEYILRTDDTINEYKSILEKYKSKSFVSRVQPLSHAVKKRVSTLIFNFLSIASEYIPIKKGGEKEEMSCEECGESKFDIKDDGMCICVNCGIEIEMLEDGAYFKDSERIKMSSRFRYSTQGYFIEAMNFVECKQNKDVTPVLGQILKEMEYQNKDVNELSLQNLYQILIDLRLDDYYNDVYLIYFNITGKLIFNITHIRAELVEMHSYIDDIYEEIKDNDNAQNVYLKLFKLLQLLDYPCKREDFFFLKDPNNEMKHYIKWREQVEILAERYPNDTTSNGKKRWRFIPSY